MPIKNEELNLLNQIIKIVNILKDTGLWEIMLVLISSTTTFILTKLSLRKKFLVSTNNFTKGEKTKIEGEILYNIEFHLHVINGDAESKIFRLLDNVTLYKKSKYFFVKEKRSLNLKQRDNIHTIKPIDKREFALSVLSKHTSPESIRIRYKLNNKTRSTKCRIPFVNTEIESLTLNPYNL